jgi:hypothetical protein
MKRESRLFVEVLEDRTAPALYGVPWSDPQHLTLSFAPDVTQIAGHTSTLFAALDAEMPPAVWQQQVLAAVQAWVVNANISVGVVSDGGQPFGAPGLTQGDPRFGDIRIGAQPMAAAALSVSVPHDPYLSGTWSGDILLNSNIDFTAAGSNLYNVMLHEFGHVLGLADNDDPTSVMYHDITSLPAAPSSADIAALQALYGRGPNDPNEAGASDNTFQTATPIQYPGSSNTSSTPLVAFGSLTAVGDADVFSLVVPRTEEGGLAVTVQTAGISLLEPSLTVYDASGNVLAQAQSTNILGDTLTVTLPHLPANSTCYIQVQGATQDSFSIGRYGLDVTFGEMEVSAAQISAVLRGPYDTLSASQIAQLFHNPEGRLHTNYPVHNTLASALALATTTGYSANGHYEVIDHLGEGVSAYYQIQAPASASGAPLVLTAAVNALSVSGSTAQVQVLDSQGNPVAANVLANGNGTYTIQAGNILPGQTYYLALSVRGEAEGNGNCSLVVDFSQPPALSRSFASGTLTTAAPQQTNTLYVAQTQLFQFALGVTGSSPRSRGSVEMTITDQSGNVVFDLVGPAGQTVSGSVLLPPGEYTVRFTSSGSRPVTYNLQGNSLTDPIGPAQNDPTLAPLYSQPNGYSVMPANPLPYAVYFYYPNGAVVVDPFLWVPWVV